MPLPFIIGGLAIAAGLTGVGSGIQGGIRMKEANDTVQRAKEIQEAAVRRFERHNDSTTKIMDDLGKRELNIMSSFDEFSNIIEKIQGRPKFNSYTKDGFSLPEYEAQELKKVSTGAEILLGGLGGAAAGTAGGFAAAGATTSAVMALGTASTGTAISALSGVAATNATLAAIGGGTLAAGGGGMALGTMILGGATLGAGILIGGIIFNVTGSKLSEKADEAYSQAKRTEREVDKIVSYLNELSSAASSFMNSLGKVERPYRERLGKLGYLVDIRGKTNWSDFTEHERNLTKNLVLLVGLLYKMCQVNIVLKDQDGDGFNTVNHKMINESINNANSAIAVLCE